MHRTGGGRNERARAREYESRVMLLRKLFLRVEQGRAEEERPRFLFQAAGIRARTVLGLGQKMFNFHFNKTEKCVSE